MYIYYQNVDIELSYTIQNTILTTKQNILEKIEELEHNKYHTNGIDLEVDLKQINEKESQLVFSFTGTNEIPYEIDKTAAKCEDEVWMKKECCDQYTFRIIVFNILNDLDMLGDLKTETNLDFIEIEKDNTDTEEDIVSEINPYYIEEEELFGGR